LYKLTIVNLNVELFKYKRNKNLFSNGVLKHLFVFPLQEFDYYAKKKQEFEKLPLLTLTIKPKSMKKNLKETTLFNPN
jgi:hypothetical protein